MAQITKERESQKFLITKKSYHHRNVKINNRKHKQDYQYSISLKTHIIVDIRGFRPREILHSRWLLICQLTLGQRMEYMLAQLVSTLYVQHVLYWRNVAPTYWPYDGPMSQLTLGQRSLSTLCQWSGQPKYSVGPTLSCYLGYGITVLIYM